MPFSKQKSSTTNSKTNCQWQSTVLTTILMALFYGALIVVSIMVCIYSIQSLIRSSKTPATITEIRKIDGPHGAPVLLLMLNDLRMKDLCTCNYKNYSTQSERNCSIQTVESSVYRYMEKIKLDDNDIQLYLKHVPLVFLYFKGPEYWKPQEVLEVRCNSSSNMNLQSKRIVEFFFLPVWEDFDSIPLEEKDVAIYEHLRIQPGMRFFPFGFENFVLLSRTEIWELDAKKPNVRIQTESSLSLIDKSALFQKSKVYGNESIENELFEFLIEVQWKDGYINHVTKFITATPWSAVSVVCTMLLMLEKSYSSGQRIFTIVKEKTMKAKKSAKSSSNSNVCSTSSFENNTRQNHLPIFIRNQLATNIEEIFLIFKEYDIDMGVKS